MLRNFDLDVGSTYATNEIPIWSGGANAVSGAYLPLVKVCDSSGTVLTAFTVSSTLGLLPVIPIGIFPELNNLIVRSPAHDFDRVDDSSVETVLQQFKNEGFDSLSLLMKPEVAVSKWNTYFGGQALFDATRPKEDTPLAENPLSYDLYAEAQAAASPLGMSIDPWIPSFTDYAAAGNHPGWMIPDNTEGFLDATVADARDYEKSLVADLLSNSYSQAERIYLDHFRFLSADYVSAEDITKFVQEVEAIVPAGTELAGYMWLPHETYWTGQDYSSLVDYMDVLSPMMYWQWKGISFGYNIAAEAGNLMRQSIEDVNNEITESVTQEKLVPCMSIAGTGDFAQDIVSGSYNDYSLSEREWQAVQVNTLGALGDAGIGTYDLFYYDDWLKGDAASEAHYLRALGDSASPTLPSIAIEVPEGGQAGEPNDNGLFDIYRTGDLSGELTVYYTIGGTATNGVDYSNAENEPLSGEAKFLKDWDSVPIPIKVIDDTLVEGTETVVITLSTNAAYQIDSSKSSEEINIEDAELPVVISITTTDGQAAEPGVDIGVLTITLDHASDVPLDINLEWPTVAVALAGLSLPIYGTDFTLVPSTAGVQIADVDPVSGRATLVVPAGITSAGVKVVAVDDTEPEDVETLDLYVVASDSYVVGTPASAAVDIFDDDDEVSPFQIVSGSTSTVRATAGDSFPVQVEYTTSDNDSTLPGLGLRMHYDSTALTFNGFREILEPVFQQQGPVDDTDDFDGDANTDKFIHISWVDMAGNWPNETLPVQLFDSCFTLAETATEDTATTIRFSSSSSAATHGFVGDPITVTVRTVDLDVDDNGLIEDAYDGVLIMRHLFGFSGNALTAGAIGSDAVRTDPAVIAAFLDNGLDSMLDPDASGSADALSDGILIRRYMSGWEDGIDDALPPAATRRDWEEIKRFLATFLPTTCDTEGLVKAAATSTLSDMPDELISVEVAELSGEAAAAADTEVVREPVLTSSTSTAEAVSIGTQAILPEPSVVTTSSGQTVSFHVGYTTDPPVPTLTGLGLRMHYDSSVLAFDSVSGVLGDGFEQQQAPVDDVDNFDSDDRTDKYILLAWDDEAGEWPGEISVQLFVSDYLATAAEGSTSINFSSAATAAGWTLDAHQPP